MQMMLYWFCSLCVCVCVHLLVRWRADGLSLRFAVGWPACKRRTHGLCSDSSERKGETHQAQPVRVTECCRRRHHLVMYKIIYYHVFRYICDFKSYIYLCAHNFQRSLLDLLCLSSFWHGRAGTLSICYIHQTVTAAGKRMNVGKKKKKKT